MMKRSLLPLCAATALMASASAQIYSTDFSTLEGWSVTTGCEPGYAWAADATPSAPTTYPTDNTYTDFLPFVSAPASLNFNNGIWIGGAGVGGFGPGGPGGADYTCGTVTSPPIDLSSASRLPVLRFMAGGWMEVSCGWDRLSLRVSSVGGGTLHYQSPCVPLTQSWMLYEYELDSSWGVVEIEFGFDVIDDWLNGGPGPFIDDLEIIDRCSIDPSSPCDDFLPFCFGDGTGTVCPCSNDSIPGGQQGCLNSSGAGARLLPSGVPDSANDTLRFQLDGAPPISFAFLVSADNALPMVTPGTGIQDNDGLRCVGGNLLRHGARATDLAGRSGFGTPGWGGMDNPAVGLIAQYGFVPGQSRYFQLFIRDNPNTVCGTGLNRSNGVKVTFQ